MEKLHSLVSLGVVVGTFLLVSCISNQSSSAEQPSDIAQSSETTRTESQRPIGQTPQEMGIENYLELVRTAKRKISGMNPDMPVRFPLGVNSPIRLSEGETNLAAQTLEYIGFVSESGEAKSITISDMTAMFEVYLNSLGVNSAIMPAPQRILVANASNAFIQAQRRPVPVLDVTARNTQTKQMYIMPNVRFLGVVRDSLNAVLNNQLSENDYNMSQLRDQIIQ